MRRVSANRSRRMVFCGVALERLELLATAGTLEELEGRGPTRSVLASHDVEPEEDEEADYVAQNLASLDGLAEATGPRVVLAVDAERSAVTVVEESIGWVRLTPFDWSWVTAIFVDEPAALPAVAEARAALADADVRIGEPGQPEAVTGLLEEHALLWFLPAELADVIALHA